MIASPRRLAARALLAVVGALLLFASPAFADEGWIIERFAADIEIQRDGTLLEIDQRSARSCSDTQGRKAAP